MMQYPFSADTGIQVAMVEQVVLQRLTSARQVLSNICYEMTETTAVVSFSLPISFQ